MTDIILFSDEPGSERALIKSALEGLPIRKMPIEDLGDKLSEYLEQANFYLGLNPSDEDITMMKMILLRDLKTRFGTLSIEEVGIAIDKGFHGDYGPAKWLSPKIIFDWIVEYKKNLIRRDLLENKRAKDEMKRPPTEEEEQKLAWYTINHAFERYKQDGYYPDFGNAAFNILWVNKKIALSPEDIVKFKSLAKRKLTVEFDPSKFIGDDKKVKEIMNIAIGIKTDDKNARVRCEAKRLALNDFFEHMVKDNITMEALFNL